MDRMQIGGRSTHARGAYGSDLPLHHWRGAISKARGEPGIEWALRVTRLETNPERAIALMHQYVGELPAAAQPIFQGAATLLAHLTYTRRPDPTPELNPHGLAHVAD